MHKLNKSLSVVCLVASLCSISASVSAIDCPVFSIDQLHVLQHSYDRGKPHDLGLTMATIAFQESTAGKHLINAVTGDYGVYQGNWKTICEQSGVRHLTFSCNKEIELVLSDINVAADHAIETLTWWDNYYHKRKNVKTKHVFEKTIRSYNAGFSPKSKNGTKYWNKFKTNLNIIKTCIKF